MAARTDVIKSAGRIFDVLEYFDTVERAVGLTELVERFRFPQSSAAAILKSLVVLGYLYHDRATRTYLPTARLAHLGTWASTLLIDRDEVIQLVTHLSRAVEETVVLGVQNDLMAQYIYVQLAARSVVYYNKPGGLRAMCSSGVGWALLSTLNDEAVRRLIIRHNAAEENRTLRLDPNQLLSTIADARRTGYAFSRGAVSPGVGMIAMPLPGDRRSRTLAIGVGGPLQRLEEQKTSIVREMRSAIKTYISSSPEPTSARLRRPKGAST